MKQDEPKAQPAPEEQERQASQTPQKEPYHKPQLVIHGKLEKVTLQTGGFIPGGGY